MRIGIFGRGKLGKAVAALAERESDLEVGWHIDLGEEPGGHVDVALDASAAGAVAGHLGWAIETGTDLVVAVTGWEHSVLAASREASPGGGVITSPNFSLSVAFMKRAALASVASPRWTRTPRSPSSRGTTPPRPMPPAGPPSSSPRHSSRAARDTLGWNQGSAEPGKINVASLRAGLGDRLPRDPVRDGRRQPGALARGRFPRPVRERRARRPALAEGPQGDLHLRRRCRRHHRPLFRN